MKGHKPLLVQQRLFFPTTGHQDIIFSIFFLSLLFLTLSSTSVSNIKVTGVQHRPLNMDTRRDSLNRGGKSRKKGTLSNPMQKNETKRDRERQRETFIT